MEHSVYGFENKHLWEVAPVSSLVRESLGPKHALLAPRVLTCAPTIPLLSLGRSVCDQLLLAQGSTFSRSAVKLKLRIWLCTNFRTFQGKSLCLQQDERQSAYHSYGNRRY